MTTNELCHRSDCHHPRSEHGNTAGCLVGSRGTFCACTKFTPAPAEETGRTIPSRTADPATSHKAAAAVTIKAGTQRTRLLQAFDLLVDATDEEAMESADGVSPASEYAKRCSELREAGFITPTGEERVGHAGQSRIVSRITDAGQAALQAAGHGVTVPSARRRMTRLTQAETHLADRFRHLAANPNGVDGRVVLTSSTAKDLVDLLDRLA